MSELRRQLERGFNRPLPGVSAQWEMAHQLRREVPPTPPTARQAAVLALFYPTLEGDRFKHKIVFIKRSSRDPRDRHAGQISFPGGSTEEEDASLATTALREAEEEIGIDPKRVELFGQLTELYIPVSNFLVTPYVGVLDHPPHLEPDFSPQPSEVDRILDLSFDDFFQPAARGLMDKKLRNGITLTGLPYWDVDANQIWGATAMITSELVALVNPS